MKKISQKVPVPIKSVLVVETSFATHWRCIGERKTVCNPPCNLDSIPHLSKSMEKPEIRANVLKKNKDQQDG